MAKQDYLFRYFTIIRKLRKSGEATFEEIREYVAEESEWLDRPASFTIRTFQRDVNEIRNLFRVDIRYDFSSRNYYIAEEPGNDLNNRMLESIDTIHSLKMASDAGQYMFFEKRKAKGTQHFHGLLQAIRNRVMIRLVHQKFDDDEPTERLLAPYALKESRGRWYLLARESGDTRAKTFGLDRVLSFEATARRFDYPAGLDVNALFRFSFGVINPDDQPPVEIILSFGPEQGKYIKSYPLHESQETIRDDEKEFRIRLTLCITHDLKMELLSYGERIRIISPPALVREMRSVYRKALEQYGKG